MRCIMLKTGIILTLTLAVAAGAFAQHRSFDLDQGHWTLAVTPGGGGGPDISGPSWAADSLQGEWAPTEEWSLGAKTSVVHTLGSGFRDQDWRPKIGGWVNFDAGRAWFPSPGWGVLVSALGQYDPQADAMTLITTVDVSGRLVSTEEFEAALLADLGVQSDLNRWRCIAVWGAEARLFRQWSLLVSFAGNLYDFGSSQQSAPWEQTWTRFADSVNLAELALKYWF